MGTRDDLRDCSVLEERRELRSRHVIAACTTERLLHRHGTAQDCRSNSPLKADQPPGPEIPAILAPFSPGLATILVNYLDIVTHERQPTCPSVWFTCRRQGAPGYFAAILLDTDHINRTYD